MIAGWITSVAALFGIIWFFIQLGNKLDKEDDPKTQERKRQLGKVLAGEETSNLTTRIQETNLTFLHAFDRLFSAKKSSIEQGIWVGLWGTPIVFAGTQIPALVGQELFIESAAGSLALAITIAFSMSLGVVTGRWLGRAGALGNRPFARGLAIFGIVIAGFGLSDISGSFVLSGLGIAFGLAMFGTGLGGLEVFDDIHIPVHPLKALGSSLAFIIVVSLFASLIRGDAATSFYTELTDEEGEGVIILAFLAFNMFADGVSLLETRWVLQRGADAGVGKLLGLLAIDLVLSAAIFLFLPLVLGQIPAFWEAALFRGDRPWLGIFFWSTFGTSAVLYAYVIAVFLFLLPGHALATGFRRVIGSFVIIEERPFTSVAYALSAVIILLVVSTGIIAALV